MLTRVECVLPGAFREEGSESRPGVPLRFARWLLRVASEFPALDVKIVARAGDFAFFVNMDDWSTPSSSWWNFDDQVDRAVAAGVTTFALFGRQAYRAGRVLGLLTRCQRVIARRNQHSVGQDFEALLVAHRALYDLGKPLVLADYRHALDTWQWTLRLAPSSGIALQIAALLHDVERLASEADVRVEQHARDYGRFKHAHAGRGAGMARAFLDPLFIHPKVTRRVVELVAGHESPSPDEELSLLNDADALSFFSLNSSGFLDYYGPGHTTRKIEYTLGRLRQSSLGHLDRIHLRRDVEELVRAAFVRNRAGQSQALEKKPCGESFPRQA